MKLYSQEIATAEKILDEFAHQQFVILLAQMQSGKTNTFKLVACEMLRRKMVKRVVIFSGNRELQLTEQLYDRDPERQEKTHHKFKPAYGSYLQDYQGLDKDDAEDRVELAFIPTRFFVLGGQDLMNSKLFEPNDEPTLYIWEESHYGQSKNQQVDKFLTRVGINANGEDLGINFVLSVSATPFSELSDYYRLHQEKTIVRLTPSEEYLSVQKLKETGRIINISDPVTELKRLLPTFGLQAGYGLIRASTKKQEKLEPIARLFGWDIMHFDQESGGKDINNILSILPNKPTILFLKGMCRMGKCVKKQHVLFGMETSSSKTDTLLQGLVGRWCGYMDYDFTANVYILKLNMTEVDRFIDLCQGQESIPYRATNIKRGQETVRIPIIPCRIKRTASEQEDASVNIADDILAALSEGKFENPNSPTIAPMINKIVNDVCERAKGVSRTDSHIVLHKSGKGFDRAIVLVKEAFEQGKSRTFGSGYGSSTKSEDELIVFQNKDELFVFMFIQSTEQFIPPTTEREVFCKTPLIPYDGHLPSIIPDTQSSISILEECLWASIELASSNHEFVWADKNNKILSNRPQKHEKYIHLDANVFAELPSIQQKFKTKGITLSWKKTKGSTPSSLGTTVRLSEISWEGTVVAARFSMGAAILQMHEE
jgi:hypothetical protein